MFLLWKAHWRLTLGLAVEAGLWVNKTWAEGCVSECCNMYKTAAVTGRADLCRANSHDGNRATRLATEGKLKKQWVCC